MGKETRGVIGSQGTRTEPGPRGFRSRAVTAGRQTLPNTYKTGHTFFFFLARCVMKQELHPDPVNGLLHI